MSRTQGVIAQAQAQAQSQALPTPTVPGPPDWWLIGSRPRPGFASGDDFRSQDWIGRDPPGLNPLMWAAYEIRKRTSDADVEADFRQWFGLLGTGATGTLIIDHFMTGGGATLHHPSGSDLSQGIAVATKTQAFLDRVKTDVDTQLRWQRRRGLRADARALAVTTDLVLSTRDGVNPWNNYPPRMVAMVGGIQGVELAVRWLRDTGPREAPDGYRVDCRLRVFDDFGVGNDDLYHGSLVSMWVLQHQRPRARPFVNMIDVQFEVANKW